MVGLYWNHQAYKYQYLEYISDVAVIVATPTQNVEIGQRKCRSSGLYRADNNGPGLSAQSIVALLVTPTVIAIVDFRKKLDSLLMAYRDIRIDRRPVLLLLVSCL